MMRIDLLGFSVLWIAWLPSLIGLECMILETLEKECYDAYGAAGRDCDWIGLFWGFRVWICTDLLDGPFLVLLCSLI